MIVIEVLGGSCTSASTRYVYQRYFMYGLATQPDVKMRFRSPVDRTFHRLREQNLHGAARLWNLYARWGRDGARVEADHVGRYVAYVPGFPRPICFAIDSHDGRRPRDPDAVAWSDMYFKTNCWPGLHDDPKIKPLPNANGALTAVRLRDLFALRGHPKTLDVSFISLLWPASRGPYFHGPVEHSVRLFETLIRLRCRARLMAIIPHEHREELDQEHIARLNDCGVPVSTRMFSYEELSRTLASSQVNLLRSGKHLCVSWRMFDLLAMGAGIVCDHAPYPEWPVPLMPDIHYLDGECRLSPNYEPPSPESYDRLASRIDHLLSNPARVKSLRRDAAAYFDAHLAPERVGAYLIDTLRAFRH